MSALTDRLGRMDVSPAVLVRIAVDLVVVVVSLVAVVAIRYASTMALDDDAVADETWASFRRAVVFGSLVLASISINVFASRGFYRHNRSYRDRYKLVAIIQAVTVSYLFFVVVLFMVWDQIDFPRSALVPAWLVTIAAISILRLGVHRVPPVARFVARVDAIGEQPAAVERVLVVGGGGYIGSALLRKLLDRGYKVRLLDLLMFGEDPIRDLLDHPDLEVVRQDFRQVDQVVKAMAGVDAVVHLGAIVGDPACEVDHELTIDTNFLATRMLAEIAQAAGVGRFVFASTCSVYGAGDEILDERSTPNPVSLYARSKIACEEVLSEVTGGSFSPVVLRFGTIYGLSGRTRFDLVVNLLTAKAVKDREITIFGGDQWRPFLHVDDAAAAVLLALEAPRSVADRQVFNVGSNAQNYTIDQVGELINAQVPEAVVTRMADDGGDRRDYRVDFSRIRDELGFEPAWTVEMGISQVIDALAAGEVSDYADAKYSNVKSLESDALVRGPGRGDRPVIQMNYGMAFDGRNGAWTAGLVPTSVPVEQATGAVNGAGVPADPVG